MLSESNLPKVRGRVLEWEARVGFEFETVFMRSMCEGAKLREER